MNVKSIISHLQKKGSFRNASQKKHPQRDWLFLVGGTLLLFFVIALWSYVSFLIQTTDTKKETSTTIQPEIKTSSIETVQSIFEERARKRVDYQSTKLFIDPSR